MIIQFLNGKFHQTRHCRLASHIRKIYPITGRGFLYVLLTAVIILGMLQRACAFGNATALCIGFDTPQTNVCACGCIRHVRCSDRGRTSVLRGWPLLPDQRPTSGANANALRLELQTVYN